MKKIFTLLLILPFIFSFSQEKNIQVGILSGIGTSFVYGKYSSKLKPNLYLAYNGGISLKYNSEKLFLIRADIMFKSEAYQESIYLTPIISPNPNNHLGTDIIINKAYLTSFSLLPGIKTKGKLHFFALAGPSLEYLIHATASQKSNAIAHDVTYNFTRRLNVGITIVTGLNIPLSEKFHFKLSLENDFALLPYHDYTALKMNALILNFGFYYQFKFNKKTKPNSANI